MYCEDLSSPEYLTGHLDLQCISGIELEESNFPGSVAPFNEL